MFLIPLQHFLAADKPFVYGSVGGYLYLVIDLFVMQVFFFLSGYFSKNAARGRQIAAGSLLWPVIVMWLACGLVRVAGFAIPIRLYRPPYAMWFLLCLFYYRMFQTAYLKIPHLAGVVFVLHRTSMRRAASVPDAEDDETAQIKNEGDNSHADCSDV